MKSKEQGKNFKTKKRKERGGMRKGHRSKSDSSGEGEVRDDAHVVDDFPEPTMGEKIESLSLLDKENSNGPGGRESSPQKKPPSADSIHVLLKQALHADDRSLLLECLYTQDEKVITNTTSLLNSGDVLKLLDSLLYILQSRGAVLACALPWLRHLLLQHASGIMSQESSLLALNSLYQLIESRVSTFQSAIHLSSCLEFIYFGKADEGVDKNDMVIPVIYEDKDESEEEVSDEAAMETDQENEELEAENGFSDEGSDSMN